MINMSASLSDYLAHLQSACSFSHVARACFLLLALLNPDDDASGGRGKKKRPGMILLWRSTMKEKNNKFITESGSDFHNSSGQRSRWLEKKKTLAHRPRWISDLNVVSKGLWMQKRGGVRSRKTWDCKRYIRLQGTCDGRRKRKQDETFATVLLRFLWSPKGRL